MKVRFFDIMIVLMMFVMAGVKNEKVISSQQQSPIWTLEEASYLGGDVKSRSVNPDVVQAVTRTDEGVEHIYKCGMHHSDWF